MEGAAQDTEQLGRAQRILIGVVVIGAVVIAAIGFAGSYAAVRELALAKGFGWFANVFPIGVDAGIVVLLALDLLLSWLRIPFPLLRQTAWLLTAATIAFNGAAAWPDPLGVGMHGIIPILFVVSVEAARHAIGRVADITADKHMESVRLARWLLAPLPTFRLWRRMKLWELRSYDEVIHLERERLIYQARLRARFGRAWRRKAPVESLMPLRFARFGIPLTETGPAGLVAASIELPPVLQRPTVETPGPVPLPGPGAEADDTVVRPLPDRAEGDPESAAPALTAAASESPSRRVTVTVAVPEAVPEPEPEPAPEPPAVTATPQEPLVAEGAGRQLTMVDRYYRVWDAYRRAQGLTITDDKLTDKVLSAHLATLGLTGRGGAPVSPSTLRRYLPVFRIYAVWNEHLEDQGVAPDEFLLAKLLAERGIVGQYNAVYTPGKLAPFVEDFPRRRAAFAADQMLSDA
ncbi:DUF2637 domain-containing protein [Streptomyces sp. MI02-7b]|uniref:DUF2637 domain-containing protein n=1 Tax=Streptomyces sp. MI02-7b TaxID=462941 RepID=UPI0029BE916D|nr:DUF2637 domain-containing protein [Streptomyces sp. MI02-7b]MDX3075855.1 DUF2637 domain-containing protein [Streptomyces sp. MI02-7b]